MARLVYAAITSLDGYIEDASGNFDWAAPDEEVHKFVNGLDRHTHIYLLGRRMYEVLSFWETVELAGLADFEREFAEIWRAADKIVYSRTLERPASARTRIERDFDPDAVRLLKADSAGNLSIGGPELAGQAISAGLVDEFHLFLNPVVVGGGKPWLPGGAFIKLELVDEHRFANGVVHLHYEIGR